MVLTPILTKLISIPTVQLIYGGIAAFSAVIFIIFSRETPPHTAGPAGSEVRALMLDGLKHAFTVKSFWLCLMVFFIGLGIFNGLTTWVESIIRPAALLPPTGHIGRAHAGRWNFRRGDHPPVLRPAAQAQALYFAGPVAGNSRSDRSYICHKQLVVVCFGLWDGIFPRSAQVPIMMQYAAEITRPTPEGTSNGLMQLFGQASVAFVYIMEALRTTNGSFTLSLILATGVLVISALLVTQMDEPSQYRTTEEKPVSL